MPVRQLRAVDPDPLSGDGHAIRDSLGDVDGHKSHVAHAKGLRFDGNIAGGDELQIDVDRRAQRLVRARCDNLDLRSACRERGPFGRGVAVRHAGLRKIPAAEGRIGLRADGIPFGRFARGE